MLNYEIHMDPEELQLLESGLKEDLRLANPFPGLRPFTINESHLFFGREDQVDEILLKLAENRFIAVLGYSGSGKSSLMFCGAVPVLYGGFLTDVGPNWNVVVTRPGQNPIDNLAEAILTQDQEFINATEEEKLINKTITSSILRSGTNGLIDAVNRYHLGETENLLLVVDQFEEIFRYKENELIKESANEATEFVNLLLEAINQKDLPIYIAITMRSDFIGDCSQYNGLTDKINESNYLVPQMTREQKRIAIEGPIAVGGGWISNRLIKKLLNDVGESQDQLPIMQHALMRTWNYWVEHKDPGEPIDIRHYNAIGRIDQALSQHADEAYEELEVREKEIAELLFKSITEKGNDIYGVRRPTSIAVIAEIAGVDDFSVINIVEKFRQPGRSLLMPAMNVTLDSETVIEISHESLMRIWARLKNWVAEEHESAQMYKRLSDAATMYQIGRTGLWRPPDLQLALNWEKKQNPTRVWAQRYDEAFERAIVFLDTSRITYEAEQRNQEMKQQRLLRRTRMVAVILAIAAVVAIIFFIFGITQQIAAESERDAANLARTRAEQSEAVALIAQDREAEARLLADEKTKDAQFNYERAEAALQTAQANLDLANRQTALALRQTIIADNARLEAENANQIAQQKTEEALQSFKRAQRLLFLSIAQSMSVKSLQIQDNDLKGLLAQQAFIFNRDYQGLEYDTYIYDGLYHAMEQIEGDGYNEFKGHKNAIRTLSYANSGSKFYSAGSDGKIIAWDSDDIGATPIIIGENQFPNRIIKISPDDKYLVNASDSSYIQVYDLENIGSDPRKIEGHSSFVFDIEFLPDNSGFYSVSNDKTIRFNDYTKSRVIKNLPSKIKSIDLNENGDLMVGASLNGEVYLINTQNFEERLLYSDSGSIIHSVKFSPDGSTLVIGNESGNVILLEADNGNPIIELVGPMARINDIEFSKDGKLMAVASWDGNVYLWLMEDLNQLPLVFKDNNSHIWDISFSSDGNYLVTGSTKDIIKIWPTNPKLLADKFCENFSRNMDLKEWDRYVGNDIKLMKTCEDFSLSER